MNSRAWLLFWVGLFAAPGAAAGSRVYVSPQKLPRVANVDERYQSYDLDLAGPAGAQAQPPVDLSSPRLRKLAAALGPAYLRVRGTADGWKDVVDFARAVDARIVASFAAGSADEANGLLASTKSMGGEIAALELFEPPAEGAAQGPSAAAFA